MKVKENKTKKWTGAYKGVDFEINNWNIEPNSVDEAGRECWTYYLILVINRIPSEHHPNSYWMRGRRNGSFIMYNYYKHHVLGNMYWHGGITWYSKESGFDGDDKIIKVGCDYSHYWDEGRFYNLDIVKEDVCRTIDSFLEYVPNYKYWCCGNGNLYDLSDGILRDGRFYSREYWGDKDFFRQLENISKL